MAELSVWDLEIGKTLNFIITSGASALNLSGAVVTLMLNDGKTFGMTIVSAGSGTVQYAVTASDLFPAQRRVGQLRVSFGTNRFFTSTFDLIVRQSLQAG